MNCTLILFLRMLILYGRTVGVQLTVAQLCISAVLPFNMLLGTACKESRYNGNIGEFVNFCVIIALWHIGNILVYQNSVRGTRYLVLRTTTFIAQAVECGIVLYKSPTLSCLLLSCTLPFQFLLTINNKTVFCLTLSSPAQTPTYSPYLSVPKARLFLQ